MSTQTSSSGSTAVRRWRAASLVVVAALFAGVTEHWAIASGVAVLVVGALAVGPRVALGRTASRVAGLVAASLGAAIGAVLPAVVHVDASTNPAAAHFLRGPWPAFALAGLLLGAALLCRRDVGRGSAVTLVPGLVALTACGEAPLGKLYGAVVVAFLVFALLALHAGAMQRDPGVQTTARAGRLARAAALLTVAVALAASFAAGLPPLAAWSEGRILHALGGAEVGFSERMTLGSLHGMLQSDEIVLRVEGRRTDYLRGAVFDHYELSRWASRRRPVLTPYEPSPPSGEADRTRVTVLGGARDRFFVPLGARGVVTDPAASIDRRGVFRARDAALAVSFESPGDGGGAGASDPSDDDLDVPSGMRPTLEKIAASWTAAATTPAERIAAIRARLQRDFTYSLDFDHHRRRDPLFDFLLDDHRGHCEYFASAMTLLARAAGVPARVAIGYRVAEENALGGYWVVRERNAHAWSEVFLPGRGFVTVDATPEGAVAANEPHQEAFAGAVWDLAARGASRAVDAVARHLDGAGRVALALALFVAVAILVRRIVKRRRAEAATRHATDKPPAGLARLLAACADRGARREAWEPLERFADRLEGPELEAAADVLRRYAGLSYGGIGSAEAVARDMKACAIELKERKASR